MLNSISDLLPAFRDQFRHRMDIPAYDPRLGATGNCAEAAYNRAISDAWDFLQDQGEALNGVPVPLGLETEEPETPPKGEERVAADAYLMGLD